MKLVIVESPAKAKTIEKYLGKGYEVVASKGHVLDLPKSELGIDVADKFKADYVIKNKVTLDHIKKEFKKADALILAVDPDREGEAIGWHIAKALKVIKDNGALNPKNAKPLSRIVFTEITKDAVQQAISHPRNIDMNLVNAQQTRRILDRLVGYQLSPLLWKKMMYGLSAGRVQSVALRLVVEKELEREAFKPEEYWNLSAQLRVSLNSKPVVISIVKESNGVFGNKGSESESAKSEFKFLLVGHKGKKLKIANESEATQILDAVNTNAWTIKDIEVKTSVRSPNPPFNTSTLQQTAANQLGMSASKTMKLAQQLYEHGLITYMRTDSCNLSKQAQDAIRKYVSSVFGPNYIPSQTRLYKTKSKVAQEAHEAIRPSDISKEPQHSGLIGEQLKLYELIWKRALACQMIDAKVELATVSIDVNGYLFEMSGQKIVFPGFLAAHSDRFKEAELPDLKIGQILYLLSLSALQKHTEPPARYTEATLIKALEANGIGRPSTYAPILNNITGKKYIEKEGKFLLPTLLGRALCKLLVDHFPKIMDIQFTAGMEDDLDNIANGEKNWLDFLEVFNNAFVKDLKKAEKGIVKEDYIILGKSDEKCPICGKPMLIKLGRFSPFLTCSDFPKCKGMLSLSSREESSIDTSSQDFKDKYQEAPKTDDGRLYNLKKSRFGYFWAHPDYPKVKDTKSLELSNNIVLELFGKAPKGSDGKQMVLRRSRFGYFWAHPDYPKIKEIEKIDNKKLNEKKKELGLL